MQAKVALALLTEAVIFAAILFGAAGRVQWPEGWIFLVLFFGPAVAITAIVAKRDPALLAERMRPPFQKGQPVWDRIFLGCLAVLFFGWLAAMGLDHRYGWTRMPVWLEFLGPPVLLSSWWISYRVFGTNTFLAPVVKIMADRGQHVISIGPYAVVRHPFYSGALLLFLGSALTLGSWLGFALSLLLGLGLVVRIFGEERELRANLAGYADYAARVRYRLVPYIW